MTTPSISPSPPYALDVANGVATVTLTATPTDDGATVAYLDESAVAIPDADANTAGHQIALGVGATVIEVAGNVGGHQPHGVSTS